VSSSTGIVLFGLGAGVLGFWAVVRFPHFGPQRVVTALAVAAAAFAAQTPLLAVMPRVEAAAGVAGAMLLVVLPALTLLFWAAGCLLRSLVDLLSFYRS